MNQIARTMSVVGVVALLTTVAGASDDVVIKRQNLMNNIVQPNIALVGKMLKPKGGTPYDAMAAKEALKKIAEVPAVFIKLFPTGTGTESKVKNRATAAIWENTAEFNKWAEAMSAASRNGIAVADDGKDALANVFRKEILASCRGCHEKFRGPKPR